MIRPSLHRLMMDRFTYNVTVCLPYFLLGNSHGCIPSHSANADKARSSACQKHECWLQDLRMDSKMCQTFCCTPWIILAILRIKEILMRLQTTGGELQLLVPRIPCHLLSLWDTPNFGTISFSLRNTPNFGTISFHYGIHGFGTFWFSQTVKADRMQPPLLYHQGTKSDQKFVFLPAFDSFVKSCPGSLDHLDVHLRRFRHCFRATHFHTMGQEIFCIGSFCSLWWS